MRERKRDACVRDATCVGVMCDRERVVVAVWGTRAPGAFSRQQQSGRYGRATARERERESSAGMHGMRWDRWDVTAKRREAVAVCSCSHCTRCRCVVVLPWPRPAGLAVAGVRASDRGATRGRHEAIEAARRGGRSRQSRRVRPRHAVVIKFQAAGPGALVRVNA